MEEILVGDRCIAISSVTLRSGEDLDSKEVSRLPAGEQLEVLEVAGRRLKVSNGSFEGWISSKTKVNEPLVEKRRVVLHCGMEDPEVGGKYETRALVAVHTEAGLKSEVKAKLKPGTVVSVTDLSPIDRYRVRISAPSITGWISLVGADGAPVVGEPSERNLGKDGVVFMPKYVKIKGLLEAAVTGDTEAFRKVAEGKDGWLSASSCRPSLNSGDVRGKTALMYAAGLGHKPLVEYLLSKIEVEVNILDDTQKTALHHASKRGRNRRPDEHSLSQSEIIGLLLQRGAQLDSRDHNGCTALMFAVANGDEAVARRLMMASAAINVQDFEGHTPLDYAVNFAQHAIVDMLREAGAQGSVDSSGAGSDCEDEAGGALPDISPSEAPQPPASVSDFEAVPSSSASSAKAQAEAEAEGAGSVATISTASSGGEVRTKKKKPRAAFAELEINETPDPADGSKSAKAKKKKAAKAKPGKRESDDVSAGMMEAVIVQEDAGQVTVQTNPEEEEDDERRRSLGRLAVLLESQPATGELDAAIKAATAAGAEEADLSEAKACLMELKLRDKAREKLRQAINDRDVPRLQTAIAKAEEAKVAGKHLDEARRVLAEEEPKQRARSLLRGAQDGGDAEQLKSALAEARRVGLGAAELAPYEELLRGAESKEKAEGVLRTAMEERSVAGLKFAIKQAKDAGADAKMLKQARAILQEEEPKQQAREMLTSACEQGTVAALQDAIRAAEEARLSGEPLLAEARAQLQREEAKEKQLASVKQTMKEVAGVDMTSIDALRQAKDQLSVAIQDAISAGVAEANLFEAETRRKKLHNTIEDIKGSIRVFCRIRPLSSKEKDQGDTKAVHATSNMSLEIEGGSKFQFDAVFTPGTQEEVFEDCRDLVQSAADGYNVTMFAYGQTGAGKTFTMYGCPGAEGTAPRTIEEVFRVIEKGKSRFSYTVMGSMLELYRNDLVDLLSKGKPGSSKKLNVKQEKSGFVVVEHLTEEECKSAEELRALLDRGTEQRSVAATAMNSESSRSHLVLIVTIVSVNRETKERQRGKILICDLAGSERLKKSQVTEDMQKEAIEINKSLTALGDVIEALTQGSKSIPYRNHKLTQLMQDSLGGSAKTLMFVNCSPANSNAQETLMSLKYATRAKKITNTAKKA